MQIHDVMKMCTICIVAKGGQKMVVMLYTECFVIDICCSVTVKGDVKMLLYD